MNFHSSFLGPAQKEEEECNNGRPNERILLLLFWAPPTKKKKNSTIGCQMNTADSERLSSALEYSGLTSVDTHDKADVIVLNSCVVRQSAEDRVVGTLGMMKAIKRANPDRVLALMGCMVGPKTDELKARFPYVDVFMKPQEYAPLLDLLSLDTEGCLANLTPIRPDISGYVPVIHGWS